MTREEEKIQSRLAPPGAGLPFLQQMIMRWIGFPILSRFISWARAKEIYREKSRRILKLARALDEADFSRRVLIEPLMGLEDSSRYWSVEMVLEHLCITDSHFQDFILLLSRGEVPQTKADTAAVKPKGGMGQGRIELYAERVGQFEATIQQGLGKDLVQTRHPHPWFGPLHATQWHTLASIHQGIHRKQVELIIHGM